MATKEYKKSWYLKNREKCINAAKKWKSLNPERVKILHKEWLAAHPGYLAAANKRWAMAHPDKVKIKWQRATISRRIRQSLCGTKGNRHWEDLVGFTINQLRKHLERQFSPEMNWENYGTYWHIDHIIPISAFNFEKPEDIDFRLCWSLKNLRPLEAKQNISKGAKTNVFFQPSLLINLGG